MASQDDQISEKRRRLFKALSAAPVVATLRPGEALANHSAYQCAASLRKISISQFIQDDSQTHCSSVAVGEDCTIEGVIYRKVYFWDKGPSAPNSASQYCTGAWGNLPQITVQIPIYPGGTLTLVASEFSGTQGTATAVPDGAFAPVPIVSVDPSTNELVISEPTTPTATECFRLSADTGVVAYVGQTMNDETWYGRGFFPQYQIETGAMAAGDYQGMAHSCLTSFSVDGDLHLGSG